MSTFTSRCLLPWTATLAIVVCISAGPYSPQAMAADHSPASAAEEESGNNESGHDEAADLSHELGVPLTFMADLAIWSLVVFLCLLAILRKYAWAPLLAGLEKREGGIQQQIDDAHDAHEKAKVLLSQHEYQMDKAQDQVREILAEARRDAEHTREEMIAAAQSETEAMKNRAVNEINQARDEALDQLFSHMANSVAEATEHVLGRTISESDDNKLIDDALAQFSPSQN